MSLNAFCAALPTPPRHSRPHCIHEIGLGPWRCSKKQLGRMLSEPASLRSLLFCHHIMSPRPAAFLAVSFFLTHSGRDTFHRYIAPARSRRCLRDPNCPPALLRPFCFFKSSAGRSSGPLPQAPSHWHLSGSHHPEDLFSPVSVHKLLVSFISYQICLAHSSIGGIWQTPSPECATKMLTATSAQQLWMKALTPRCFQLLNRLAKHMSSKTAQN